MRFWWAELDSNPKILSKPLFIRLLEACSTNAPTHLFIHLKDNGQEKWIDFVLKYPHVKCISKKSLTAFSIFYKQT